MHAAIVSSVPEAQFVSDGTLKMLAYLIVLHDPDPPQFVGIEEPENFLHPRLLPELAEECRAATRHSQLLVTSHSPFFLNGAKPEEVRVLYRDEDGYTQAVRTSDIAGVKEFIDEEIYGEAYVEHDGAKMLIAEITVLIAMVTANWR